MAQNLFLSKICKARLDRVLFGATLLSGTPPQFGGYKRASDHFVRPQGTMHGYRRVQKLTNRKTESLLGIQYQSLRPWLPDAKITMTAAARNELSPSEFEDVFKAFENPQLLQFELAFDFSTGSGVDRECVRTHGYFGKSRPVGGNFYSTLNYGTHHSPSYVRCYSKPELSCYRIEVQVHSSWLRRKSIQQPEDICRAAQEIVWSRFRFVRIDLDRLQAYLAKTRGEHQADKLVEQVRLRKHALHRALHFLRKELRIPNAHRFLAPVRHLNREVAAALTDWERRWGCHCER